MTKRKRKGQFDDYDDWANVPSSDDVKPEQEVSKVSLEDFIVEEKVDAFRDSYEPCDELDFEAEAFDDSKLREYFKAYVCGLGDPLRLYVGLLSIYDFNFKTSLATGEPTIFVRRKREISDDGRE